MPRRLLFWILVLLLGSACLVCLLIAARAETIPAALVPAAAGSFVLLLLLDSVAVELLRDAGRRHGTAILLRRDGPHAERTDHLTAHQRIDLERSLSRLRRPARILSLLRGFRPTRL